jgi:hypothetical protein
MTWRGVCFGARRVAIPCGPWPTSNSSGITRPFTRIEGVAARRFVRSARPREHPLGRRGKKTVGVDQALAKSSAER